MSDAITGLELTCREVIDFVMAYLDRELPSHERTIFEAHLAICRECRDYLATYQTAVALGKQSLAQVEPAVLPPIPEDLVQAILAARSR